MNPPQGGFFGGGELMNQREKIEIFKTILKRLHQGESIETLKKEFGEIIAS
jgi:DUF438 domain-containing protein